MQSNNIFNSWRWPTSFSSFTNPLSKKTFVGGIVSIGAVLLGLGYFILRSNRRLSPPTTEPIDNRKIIVITDLEPDDRVGLEVLASCYHEDQILMVGTTVMHAARKAVLVKRLLRQLNLGAVPVYQGTGGASDAYPDIHSTKAAKTYKKEGLGILPQKELLKVRSENPSSNELQIQLKRTLRLAQDDTIEFALLAPPTDLVRVLDEEPALKSKIKRIYVMGGWSEFPTEKGNLFRTTYNWDMDLQASFSLMEMTHIPMTLYSSHMFKRSFSGGSISKKSYPHVFQAMKKCNKPYLVDAAKARWAWNTHVMETIPALKSIIEPHRDHQFTPADPAVVIGMINDQFIVKEKKVKVKIHLDDQTENGCLVDVEDDPTSLISLVEEFDPKVFEAELIATYEHLSTLGKI